jgi:hypothetical protein
VNRPASAPTNAGFTVRSRSDTDARANDARMRARVPNDPAHRPGKGVLSWKIRFSTGMPSRSRSIAATTRPGCADHDDSGPVDRTQRAAGAEARTRVSRVLAMCASRRLRRVARAHKPMISQPYLNDYGAPKLSSSPEAAVGCRRRACSWGPQRRPLHRRARSRVVGDARYSGASPTAVAHGKGVRRRGRARHPRRAQEGRCGGRTMIPTRRLAAPARIAPTRSPPIRRSSGPNGGKVRTVRAARSCGNRAASCRRSASAAPGGYRRSPDFAAQLASTAIR